MKTSRTVGARLSVFRKTRSSAKVDAALGHLAMPSLGQWRDIFRDTLLFLGKRPEGDPWSRKILERLASKRDDPRLDDIFGVLARSIKFSGRRPGRQLARNCDSGARQRERQADLSGANW